MLKIFLLLLGLTSATYASEYDDFMSKGYSFKQFADFENYIKSNSYKEDIIYLTEAVYHESRGESNLGKRAVMHVLLNRKYHGNYSSLRSVVYKKNRGICEFSYACDNIPDNHYLIYLLYSIDFHDTYQFSASKNNCLFLM